MKEINIEEIIGKQNPFKVPEGYFSQLQKEIMSRLPERPSAVAQPTFRNTFLRPIIGVAASACLAIAGISIYSSNAGFNSATDDASTVLDKICTYDNVADYIAIDNDDIYRYLVERCIE